MATQAEIYGALKRVLGRVPSDLEYHDALVNHARVSPAPESPKHECSTCLFWEHVRYDGGTGEMGACRHRSPVRVEPGTGSPFPEVRSTAWCGEYVTNERVDWMAEVRE